MVAVLGGASLLRLVIGVVYALEGGAAIVRRSREAVKRSCDCKVVLCDKIGVRRDTKGVNCPACSFFTNRWGREEITCVIRECDLGASKVPLSAGSSQLFACFGRCQVVQYLTTSHSLLRLCVFDYCLFKRHSSSTIAICRFAVQVDSSFGTYSR